MKKRKKSAAIRPKLKPSKKLPKPEVKPKKVGNRDKYYSHVEPRLNTILAWRRRGLTNKEIAQKLNLSNYTVKSHVHNILEKLTLDTRVQIAKFSHLAESN